MTRRAILVLNSVSYGETSKNVPRKVVQQIASELEERLVQLEPEFRYLVTVIDDDGRAGAREKIRRAVKSAGDAGDSILFFYFGHAFQPEDTEDLYLHFKDSTPYDLPTMLKFSEVVEFFHQYRVKEVLAVMDCCYAGMVARQLQLLNHGGSFFIMASVNATGKALVDYSNEQPIGLFTKHFIQAFGSRLALAAHGREVTYASFFKYVDMRMKASSKQRPYSRDNGMSNHVFFRQSSTPIVLPELRRSVPKKSIYRKLFAIGTLLLNKEFGDFSALHKEMEKRNCPEFLQPLKSGNNELIYGFVSAEAFRSYIDLGRLLGYVETADPLRLTAAGKRMVRSDGDRYNSGLFELLNATWSRIGLRIQDFEDIVGQRLNSNSIPNVEAIYRDMFLTRRLQVSKQLFKVLLDLTAYVGALDYSAEKTFFLAGTQDFDEFLEMHEPVEPLT
jgi:hypothetical protein